MRAAFNLSSTAGRESLLWWYLRHGFPELGLQFDPEDDASLLQLNQPLPGVDRLSYLPITWLMRGLIDRKRDQEDALADRGGQERLLAWYFARGMSDANLLSFLTEDQAAILRTDSPDTPRVPRILTCLWATIPSLQERFAGPSDPTFLTWCRVDGVREFPILGHPLIALAGHPARPSHVVKPFGVNLLGHAQDMSGVGEDVRMAAKVLAEANIPFVVHNASVGRPDHSNGSSLAALPYAINLFAMTAASTAGVASSIGSARMAEHYNIGYWPWELPELPEFWRHSYDLMDEIWASSRFTYDAFTRSSSKPVKYVPFAVAADETDGLTRRDFGLPLNRFLFGFAFDGSSSFARKAPLSVIEAFQNAFPAADQSAGLVIKGLRAADAPQWSKIEAAARSDGRIFLLTEPLPRGSLLDLWRALDCFVSLHRSEGFGRNIAEAMLLKKPVVITGHSGNMDFNSHENSAIVTCHLRPVKQGEYPYCTGQLWAEPNIADAARHMREIASDPLRRYTLASAGERTIADRYSCDAVGRQWAAILHQVSGIKGTRISLKKAGK